MAKASFASADAYEPKLGFQEGTFEVLSAGIKVFQYPPSRESGEQSSPFLAAALSIQKLDDQGHATDDEPMEKILRIEKDLSKMRPGKASSREDDDPTDLGDELDTEGNVIFVEEGAKINKNTTFAVFINSLEEKGFKSPILKAGFMPDLVGMKAHAVNKKAEKRNINGKEIEPSYFVVDRILVYPYEVAAAPAKKAPASAAARGGIAAVKKPAAASAAATPAPGAMPAAAPPAAPNNGAGSGSAVASEEADAAATALLLELSAELEGGEPRDAKKLFAMAYSRLVKDKTRDKKLDKPVGDLFRNEEWLIEKSGELGTFTFDDGVFQFGEAAPDAA